MRRLILFRHAKAERAQPGERDRDRRLSERGRADAPKIGAYLVHHALTPDLVVVSAAARTRETWQLAASAFADAPPAVYEERIYEASPQAILAVIRATGAPVGTLLLIGHNPGLHELATLLVATGDVEARQRLREGLPTSGLAVIDFTVESWSRLHAHSGRLHRFVSPRLLEAATD